MSIDENMRQAVEAVAKAKIAEAFGTDILGKLVDEVMQHEDRSIYSKKGETFIDTLVMDAIERSLQSAVAEAVKNNSAVQGKIKDALSAKVDAMAVQILGAMDDENDWRVNLSVDLGRKNDD